MKRFDIEVQDRRAYLVGNPDGKYVKHEDALETLTALFDVTAQRDQLLAVLEAMLEEVAGCYCTTEASARAVIQKVRGWGMLSQQEVIDLAVEVGLAEVTDTAESLPAEYVEALAKFAALAVAKETEARIKLQKEFMEYQNDMQARGTRLIKEAYQRGVRDERNACLAEVETGIWLDKTTEEVLAEIAAAIHARGKEGGAPC